MVGNVMEQILIFLKFTQQKAMEGVLHINNILMIIMEISLITQDKLEEKLV
jgi:hypothetical protein